MRPILLNISVNEQDYHKFNHSKPASETKTGDGRCAGGHAERKTKLSRNEVLGASESLARTIPKSWCSTGEWDEWLEIVFDRAKAKPFMESAQ